MVDDGGLHSSFDDEGGIDDYVTLAGLEIIQDWNLFRHR